MIADWSKLDYHGDNGILTFIISLYSWGIAATAQGLATTLLEWVLAVQDVSWCLRHLVEDVDRTEKPDSPEPPAAARKR